MKRYFITGTDTDCGKTYVTAKLVEYFPNAAALKPVASGCSFIENQLVSTDAQQLQQNSPLSLNEINPWRFKLPVSPHIASKEEGVCLSMKEIAEYCMNFELKEMESLFIEGAGGLMVPLNENETWIDFLKHTRIPVILVVGLKLGCINHALLTATAFEANNIECMGWIANCLDPQMLAISDNMSTLTNMLKFPLLATLPYCGGISDIQYQLF